MAHSFCIDCVGPIGEKYELVETPYKGLLRCRNCNKVYFEE